MTRNQLEYLRNEEMRRNNLITERQKDTELKELGRHNLVSEKEAKRSNKAQEKLKRQSNKNMILTAQISSRATKSAAKMSSSASRYSADQSAQAAKYSADSAASASRFATTTNAAVRAADRAQDAANKAAQLKNDSSIAALRSRTSAFTKKIDALIKMKELSQRERESLRKTKSDLDLLQRRLAHDSGEKAMDRMFSSLNKAQDIITRIGSRIKK